MTTKKIEKIGRDAYGLRLDTKQHRAAMLYERGRTPEQVRLMTNDSYTKLIKELEKQGHTVLRNKNTGIVKLIPKKSSKTQEVLHNCQRISSPSD
jgi:hypothetical protein